MKISEAMVQVAIRFPKQITVAMVLATLALGSLVTLVKVDTDPENMLPADEPVRIFHNQVKKEFGLYDVVVLGVVNEKDPDGVFNPATLKRLQELTEYIATLEDPDDPGRRVVSRDLIAPGNVDVIEQAGLGQVRFEWMMKTAPSDSEQALRIRDLAMRNPLLRGTLVSEDGRAIGIYIPLTSKDFADEVRTRLLARTASLRGDDQFYITGLPVAEDTFGREMFVQMAISAPLAMLVIFLLMLAFFRKIQLITAPMIIAMVTVVSSMGLLIGTGHTLHIMSSMIPIFLMPIAVVDSIHILSEFFDSYQKIGDRRQTIEHVLRQLFTPMLYTSLTSAAGFASLAMTPIPPVQVFGIFVAIGIMLAWLLTIIFIPSYIMLMKEKSLANFGVTPQQETGRHQSVMSRFLRSLGGMTYRRSKLILSFSVLALVVAAYGISRIQINDNPVKWFTADHPIRQADRALNRHFGGTYEAYLILEGNQEHLSSAGLARLIEQRLPETLPDNNSVRWAALTIMHGLPADDLEPEQFLETLAERWDERQLAASDADYEAWGLALDGLEQVRTRDQVFKRPEVLRYLAALEDDLQQVGVVGKSNSVADVVKTVHRELFEGREDHFRIPETVNGVAQTLISYQNSHKPDDLYHLVTPDYRKANLWVQLKSGDNKDMDVAMAAVERFFRENPPPVPLKHQWAGLTYINNVWQNHMVTGMLESFLGSFAVVLVMMIVLFRSVWWGLLAMVPLSVTIAFIYGLIGIVGKDYDMPVAVLSSLTLGMAVDFAIHFLERARATYRQLGSWREAAREMFEEPARAITRNAIVIAVGFTPLLAAPLVPYKTVGFFLASIMAVSGLATMFILPALIATLQRWLFGRQSAKEYTHEENNHCSYGTAAERQPVDNRRSGG